MLSLMPWKKEDGIPKLFYSPFREMEEMMNRMTKDFIGDMRETGISGPALNMYKEDDNIVIDAAVPNYNKEDITVELNGNELTIKGRHREETEKKDKDYYYREFHSGSFSRTVKLPVKVESKDLKARYQDGMLKITLPSVDTETRGEKIEIE